ncbi:MAG: type II toxin-antitoxin system HipA family toxin [Bifidobacterium crudilactis]|jgi:serine/threonine-protein kinase HipA
MSYTGVDIVEVRAWGNLVGALTRSADANIYVFQYAPEWIRSGIELSPIEMPLRRAPYVFPNLSQGTFQGLPPMIVDSLPDSFGSALIDAWMADQGIARSLVTPLDRLVYLGKRGMGALEYEPDYSPKSIAPSALDMSELIIAARAAVQGTLLDDESAQQSLQQIVNVGISAGGARAKAIVNVDPRSLEVRSGHVPPVDGFEPWLLKFDGVGRDRQLGGVQGYGRVEYAYSLMAKRAGIEMGETRLLEEHGRAHFMTRRFDRDGLEKLHMQSLTGLSSVDFRATGANSYAQVFTAAQQLGLGRTTGTEIWRRMVFNIAATNNDDHAKNVSFLADRLGNWRLSPAYDVTFAFNPTGEWTNEHQMSVNGKFRDIGYDDIMAVADLFEVERTAPVLQEIRDALDSWKQFAATAGVPVTQSDVIARQFHTEVLH